MRLRLFIFAAVFLVLPITASAEQETTLQLGDASEQAQWHTIGLQPVDLVSKGIHVTTSVTGTLSRPIHLSHRIDVIEVLYSSPRRVEASLLWRKRGSKENQYLQIPITFNPSPTPVSVAVDMGAVGQWDPRAVAIGFQFPPGTDVTLYGVRLQGWSLAEKFIESIKCFWVFDGLKAYSINFFWGPLLCDSPVTRTHLFQSQPPAAHSAMRVVYELLILGAIIIAIRGWMKSANRRSFLLKFGALFFVFWIFLDIRMGAEFIATWTYDVRSYLLQPVGKRTFRRINFLFDFAAAARGILADQPRYVLLAPTTDTFMNFMRYQTYPSQPVNPSEGSGASVWLVYERRDLVVGSGGQIMEDGVPLSPPGQVVHEFMKGTYIFRTTTPASAAAASVSSTSQNNP